MKYRFFKIPVQAASIAQEELNAFCAEHQVAHVEKEFVSCGENSFWAICVTYMEKTKSRPPVKGKIDYRDVLNERDFAIFVKLRELRKAISEREGIPAYALFTNEQLAEMVRKRVANYQMLGSIEGVGKARLEKYGASFISLLRSELEKMSRKSAGKTANEAIRN